MTKRTTEIGNPNKNHLENEISMDELAEALKRSKKNSSPGFSGFSYEFFKVFWI